MFVIAGDAAFVGYPGSPYTETAAIFGLLVLAPAAAFCTRCPGQALVEDGIPFTSFAVEDVDASLRRRQDSGGRHQGDPL